jgi:hypothetical protein
MRPDASRELPNLNLFDRAETKQGGRGCDAQGMKQNRGRPLTCPGGGTNIQFAFR